MKRSLIIILVICALLLTLPACNKEKLTLRIGTYNIKNGGNVDHDMSVIAQDIISCDLDIVGLQEVDMKTKRCGGIDTLKLLAEAAGYEYYEFTKAIDYQGGEYGTAIMSRYPITSFEVKKLPTNEGMEGRALGHAVIDVNGKSIDFFNTHLSYEDKDVIKKQFKQLHYNVKDSVTFIITADFNTSADSNFELIKNSVRANNKEFNTYSNKSAIDDIVLYNKWTVVDKGMMDIQGHSDHSLFWAEIQYKGKI
ncbi:MAG: hypothetical protein E7634_01930 [Ruminococcaceae bacterium]|nr:hypothetical protein [Oscillospiraceae bacterium]